MPLVTETGVRRSVVLIRPQRVGKTVMMYHAVQNLLENEIYPLKVALIAIKTPVHNNIGLEQLFGFCRKATKQESPKGGYIFFDEIQYLKDWEVHIQSVRIQFYKNKNATGDNRTPATNIGFAKRGCSAPYDKFPLNCSTGPE